jgi:hypothetical protein
MHLHRHHQDTTDARFADLLRIAMDGYRARQETFSQAIAGFSAWNIDKEAATLTLTGDGGRTCVYQATPIVTYLPALESLAWAWANDVFPALSRNRAAQVRELAAQTGYQVFDTPQLRATPSDMDELCALALHHLQGIAVFKAKGQEPWVCYVLHAAA